MTNRTAWVVNVVHPCPYAGSERFVMDVSHRTIPTEER